MSNFDILLTEKCGTLGRIVLYRRDERTNTIVRLSTTDSIAKSIFSRTQDVFREIFLPSGYPDSVSDDYLTYQIWDTVQAFCSTITGTFTTQAILKSVGVGDAEATPFAAALTWVLKDGTGMVGRITFAWWKGRGLDADCKKWRLCADILNDAAMSLELLVPYVKNFSLEVLCLTTAMKAIVGVAGGATRAAITQHQSIQGNTADVSAKDGSQETCVNLMASFVGIYLLSLSSSWQYEWSIFAFFTTLHLMANYFAVCSLTISHLNIARVLIVLQTYLRLDTVPNPKNVNKNEPVVIGCGENIKNICGFNIKIGSSLKKISSIVTSCELTSFIEVYKNSKYLFIPDLKRRTIYIALEKGECVEDVIAAYFQAVLLGITICYYNQLPVNVYSKRQLHHVTPIMRLYSGLKSYQRNANNREEIPSPDVIKVFNDIANRELPLFFTALKINGWDLNSHSIEMNEWRANWKGDNLYSANHSKAE